MPWIYYGDDSYCSCPHCESEEGDDMKYLPHEPVPPGMTGKINLKHLVSLNTISNPLSSTKLFYRLSTDSIGTPFASATRLAYRHS